MIRIESTERGFFLVVTDEDWTISDDTFSVHVEDPDALYKAVMEEIVPWIAEREAARAEWLFQAHGDTPVDDAYPLDSPKHPNFHDRMSSLYDDRAEK